MITDKAISDLDDLGAPNNYVAPPTEEDIAYSVHFRQTCRRYNINFARADADERDFVMRMAEKSFHQEKEKSTTSPAGEELATRKYDFSLTEQETKKIAEWQKKHDQDDHNIQSQDDWLRSVGAVGDRYSYTFVPTSIGTLGVVKCSCGKEFAFRSPF